MNYNQILDYLDSLQMHKVKLGLGAMQNFLNKAGNPEKKCRFIHIAGTNGKGSVCAALSAILSRKYSIGIYTSPHLSSVRERMRINNEYISKEDFTRLGTLIADILREEKITYFEFVTSLAFLWFAENDVDLVLLETGMGGRLDATNVVTPLLSIITSISMDHREYLGETIREIAAEKAGIIKKGIPVISGVCNATEREDDDAESVIAESAKRKGAPLFRLHHEFDYTITGKEWHWHSYSAKVYGDIEALHNNNFSPARKKNDSLAIAALKLLKEHNFHIAEKDIYDGLNTVFWAGRREYFTYNKDGKERRFLLDGAHNEEGIANLAAGIKENFPYNQYTKRRIAIIGCMADKDIERMAAQLGGIFDLVIAAKSPNIRTAEPQKIAASFSGKVQGEILVIESPQAALQKALESTSDNDVIIVCGSLYLIGKIRPLLCGHLTE